MKMKFKRGFSLVELLVVIAIIGILAAVGITAYSGYTANAKVKASDAQFAKVKALVNAEFAKCAAGEGNYAWSGACDTTVADESVVGHFGDGKPDDLKNPYFEDMQSVVVNFNAYPGSSPATKAIFKDTEKVTAAGAITVFCSATLSTDGLGADVKGGDGCQLRHNNGSEDHDTANKQNMVTILRY